MVGRIGLQQLRAIAERADVRWIDAFGESYLLGHAFQPAGAFSR